MATATDVEASVLIVGSGVFGASTAYHLSQQYKDRSNIVVIDREPIQSALAASTDINKIIRADYSSEHYCELAYEAIEAWATWPELKQYYHQTGWINLEPEGSDLGDRIRQVFRKRGHDPTETLSLDATNQRWKGVLKGTDISGFRSAYWNPEAGWCDAAAATASVMEAAISRGVKYVVGNVETISLGSEGVNGVRTTSGLELTADKVVLATGAWTSSLLSPVEDALNIAETDRIERQATAAGVGVVHYQLSEAEMEKLSEMPVVVYGEHGEVIPPPESNSLLKYTNAKTFTNTITTKSGHEISAPTDSDQHDVPLKLQQETEASMSSRVMPSYTAGKTAAYWRLCWDAYTPTQDWLLSRHPHARLHNLFFAIGGSFHSYKFLPTVGKYAANVISGKSNGAENDHAWSWKTGDVGRRGAHEKTRPRREYRDLLIS